MAEESRFRYWLKSGSLGLALSGGGARGLAHIGVLKVLEREGIKVDVLAGTSMGGLIAAAYAAGVSPSQLESEALRMSRLRELVRLLEWFPPKGELLDSSRIRHFLTDRLGLALDFDNLAIPLTLVAVDMNNHQQVLMSEGSVLKAVEATTALPGLFQPVEHMGRRLVDGGVLNNLPTDCLVRGGLGRVMAVDVGFHLGGMQPKQQVPILGLLPGVATEFYQVGAMMVAEISRERLRRYPPDLLLRPELPVGSGVLSGFIMPQAIIDSGEAAAVGALEQIKGLRRQTPRRWFKSLKRYWATRAYKSD
jgi:NTE family protein